MSATRYEAFEKELDLLMKEAGLPPLKGGVELFTDGSVQFGSLGFAATDSLPNLGLPAWCDLHDAPYSEVKVELNLVNGDVAPFVGFGSRVLVYATNKDGSKADPCHPAYLQLQVLSQRVRTIAEAAEARAQSLTNPVRREPILPSYFRSLTVTSPNEILGAEDAPPPPGPR